MTTRNTSTAVAVPEPPASAQVFDDDVQEFLSEHRLDSPLRKAMDVATKQFKLESAPTARLVEDAESGEKWVEINVRARGEIDEVRAAYRQYTQTYLGLIPQEHALKIRLSIHIA